MSKNIRSRKKAKYLKPLSTDAVSCLLEVIGRVSFFSKKCCGSGSGSGFNGDPGSGIKIGFRIRRAKMVQKNRK
jgi:hypothetical protein